MRTLPTTMIQVLAPFAPLFSKCVWQHAQTLLAGAILAPGRRTGSCRVVVRLSVKRGGTHPAPPSISDVLPAKPDFF